MKETEAVVQIPIAKLTPFPDHPFYVRDDEMMEQLVDSIRHVGVLSPVIVRQTPDGFYQLISGHRRIRACEKLGIKKLPAVIKDVDQETATIMMVDSNFQRDIILPSEKAHAYKMKLEVIKKQGARTDLTSAHDGQKLKHKSSRELIAQNCPDSSTQIQRYIRLNELIPEMLDAVDNRKFAVTPAVEISYLSAEEQSLVLITMESEQVGPSLSQAQRLRRHSKEGTLTDDMVLKILSEQNKPESRNLSLPISKISRYFPSSYTPQKMEETIYQLLDHWLAVKMKKQAGKGGR